MNFLSVAVAALISLPGPLIPASECPGILRVCTPSVSVPVPPLLDPIIKLPPVVEVPSIPVLPQLPEPPPLPVPPPVEAPGPVLPPAAQPAPFVPLPPVQPAPQPFVPLPQPVPAPVPEAPAPQPESPATTPEPVAPAPVEESPTVEPSVTPSPSESPTATPEEEHHSPTPDQLVEGAAHTFPDLTVVAAMLLILAIDAGQRIYAARRKPKHL